MKSGSCLEPIRNRYGRARRADKGMILDEFCSIYGYQRKAKSIRQTMRSWKTHRWTRLAIEELAASVNPVLRGWLNYYGKFYKSCSHLNSKVDRS